MNVTAFNPDVLDLEKSYLQQSYDVNTTILTVRNNQRFNANDRVLIGEPGLSSSEIVTVGAPPVDGITLPVSATLYQHEADAPVYQLQFDQVKFYLSTQGIAGPYTTLDIANLDVTSESLRTTYNHTASQPGYYYVVTMYNSISGVESAQSDPIPAVTGWARNQVGYLIDQMYQELSDVTEDNLSRSEMIGYLNEVNDDLTTAVVRPYSFLYKRQTFARAAASNTLAWPTDPTTGNNLMWKFDRMDYNFVDTITNPVTNTTYTVPVVGLAYFRNRYTSNENDNTTQSDYIQEMALDESQQTFNYYPYSLTASPTVFYLYYWTFFIQLVSEGDYFQTPTIKIYKHYISYKYYLKRAVIDETYLQISDRQFQQYNGEKLRYAGQNRRDVGTPRRFESPGRIRKSFRR